MRLLRHSECPNNNKFFQLFFKGRAGTAARLFFWGDTMDEEKARIELYWKAVHLLNQYIEEGHATHDEVIEELEDDLTD